MTSIETFDSTKAQQAPNGANTTVIINWNAEEEKFILHQRAPIRLKPADTVTLALSSKGGDQLPDGSKISHVVIYHRGNGGGQASKTPNNRLGTWRCDAANPTDSVFMGVYAVDAHSDLCLEVKLKDTEKLSYGLEHHYVYSVEVETDDHGRFYLDPELINESDLPSR